ncbi:MAG: DsbA family oxidoreductase [Sulfuritalea sp.]|jgi:predicted DsbA family dithiol-disulfide isomerase|nr:DsbA family oxidoreductase [Sulfuritalea sp.]MDP1983557.1 DsbA family oxidoreductase [Sulfuritalea sp.]
MKLKIDVVSDVVCPWCFIGKRHLDRALELWREEQPACEVAVHWRPFFLNPDTPEAGEPYRPFLEKKFGGPKQLEELWQRVREAGRSAGIAFAFEKIELRANTLSAHRLIHHAQSHTPEVGAGATAIGDLVEALFAAQFLEGRHVGDRAVLADIAAACGMDRAATLSYLESGDDADAVRGGADEARRKGINGVPFFIVNNRLAASGAQPPQALLQVMRQAVAAAA